jgi:sec-independent protein translocase protein TatC
MNKNSTEEMSFLDHLEDLRWHLLRSVLAILITGSIAFIAKDFIFDKILFGPKNINFFTYELLCSISNKIGLDESFCINEMPFRIQSRTMSGQFSAHIWMSITAGFIMSFPYVIYQFWSFISPGLYENEKSNARGFIIISSFLFFIGVLFGYYIVTPLSINFLGSYSVSSEIFNDFDLDSYVGLVRASVLASGLIFELPIIVYFLTKIGVITPEIMIKYRKFALIIVLTLSAVITPPDIASQIIVAIPIIILYQISIYISKFVIRKEKRKNQRMKLTAQGIFKSYKGRKVVNDISVEVNQGEIVGLLGPNGAGKTTCFYMIVGLIKPDGGKISLDSSEITTLPMYMRAQKGIGYLAQEASVFRKLSIEDNIKAVLELTTLSNEEQSEKMESLLNEFNLQKIRKSRGDLLSGGERRRTEIARALATDPKFVLLDEPFAGVDPIAVEDIQKIISHLKKRNIGILITDHNVQETLAITDRTYLMFEGNILKSGKPEDLAEDEMVRKLYLGQNFEFRKKKLDNSSY